MGIQRSDRHKRTKTGAKRGIHKKKRKFALARPPSNTKIGEPRIKEVRTRGGNKKDRALRLKAADFHLVSHDVKIHANIMQVMYHPSNTELMRTNTITKGAVVKISNASALKEAIGSDLSNLKAKDKAFVDLLDRGHIYAVICSRPGQEGKADGRILQGDELSFYTARFKKGKAFK